MAGPFSQGVSNMPTFDTYQPPAPFGETPLATGWGNFTSAVERLIASRNGLTPGAGGALNQPVLPGVLPTAPQAATAMPSRDYAQTWGGQPQQASPSPTTPFVPTFNDDALANPPGSGSGGGQDRATRILTSIAGPESRNNPNAVNGAGSSAKGLFQMTNGTWDSYLSSGGHNHTSADRMNPDAQWAAGRWYLGQIDQQLTGKIGRPPSDNEARLAWALGPAGAGAFLTADPNADAFATYSRVTGPDIAKKAFEQNGGLMRPGMTVGQVTQAWNGHFANQPRGPGVAGGTNVPTPQAGQTPPDPQARTPMNDPLASLLPQEQPANNGMFSSMNLLRMASAAAGGKNLNESLGGALGAIPKGMQEDELMGLQRAKINGANVGEAAKLMELGINPAVAMDLASGRMNRQQASQALAGVNIQGKQQNAGIFYDAAGNAQGMNYNPRGGTFTPVPLPTGMARAEDGMMRHIAKGDAEAIQKLQADYGTSSQALTSIGHFRRLLDSGELPVGADMFARAQQLLTKNLGLSGGTAQGIAENITAQLGQLQMGNYRGLGPMSDRDMTQMQKALPNIQTDPNALRYVLDMIGKSHSYKMRMAEAWQDAPTDQKTQGFGNFRMQWQRQNPWDSFQVPSNGSTPAQVGGKSANDYFR